MSYDAQSRINLLKSPKNVVQFDFDDFDDDFDDKNPSSQSVYPVDGIVALLLRANDFLCQDLMVRLNACQLPYHYIIVLRNPISNELTFPL